MNSQVSGRNGCCSIGQTCVDTPSAPLVSSIPVAVAVTATAATPPPTSKSSAHALLPGWVHLMLFFSASLLFFIYNISQHLFEASLAIARFEHSFFHFFAWTPRPLFYVLYKMRDLKLPFLQSLDISSSTFFSF